MLLPEVNDDTQQAPFEIRAWHTTVPMRSLVGGRLSYTWKDQGWGWQKGLLHVRTVDSNGQERQGWMQILPENAPHSEKTEDIALPERLFEKDVSLSLQFGYHVGFGGGHKLHVRNAFFFPVMDFMEKELKLKEEELENRRKLELKKRNTLEQKEEKLKLKEEEELEKRRTLEQKEEEELKVKEEELKLKEEELKLKE